MISKLFPFEDNRNSAAMNGFWVHGYVIWWKSSIICRMQHFLFEDFWGEGVVMVNNNTLVRIQEKWAVGKSINWNNLSGRQSGNRHKKPKNIYALWLIMLLPRKFLLSIYMAQMRLLSVLHVLKLVWFILRKWLEMFTIGLFRKAVNHPSLGNTRSCKQSKN